MNSDEEREIFLRYGWEYDYVQRWWQSPVNKRIVVTTDDLVEYTQDEETEARLLVHVQRYGRLT